MLYVQEIVENEDGGFAGLSMERAFVFMTLSRGRFIAYGIKAKDVPRDHVEAFTKAPSSAEDKPSERVPPEKFLRVALRLDDAGRLEVYDLNPLVWRSATP